MSLALHYWMGDVHHCSRAPVSEMTYAVSSGTLNSTIPYHTILFVILVTHPRSFIETTDRRDFGGKPSMWRWGRMLSWKIPEFCSVGGARSQNIIFFCVLLLLRLSCAQPTENSFTPNQWHRWKAKTLKVCLLLVWRVCMGPGIWQI